MGVFTFGNSILDAIKDQDRLELAKQQQADEKSYRNQALELQKIAHSDSKAAQDRQLKLAEAADKRQHKTGKEYNSILESMGFKGSFSPTDDISSDDFKEVAGYLSLQKSNPDINVREFIDKNNLADLGFKFHLLPEKMPINSVMGILKAAAEFQQNKTATGKLDAFIAKQERPIRDAAIASSKLQLLQKKHMAAVSFDPADLLKTKSDLTDVAKAALLRAGNLGPGAGYLKTKNEESMSTNIENVQGKFSYAREFVTTWDELKGTGNVGMNDWYGEAQYLISDLTAIETSDRVSASSKKMASTLRKQIMSKTRAVQDYLNNKIYEENFAKGSGMQGGKESQKPKEE